MVSLALTGLLRQNPSLVQEIGMIAVIGYVAASSAVFNCLVATSLPIVNQLHVG